MEEDLSQKKHMEDTESHDVWGFQHQYQKKNPKRLGKNIVSYHVSPVTCHLHCLLFKL